LIAYGDYALVAGVAAMVTFVATFPLVRIAGRIGAVVAPGEDRVHDRPTPTSGGIAMLVAFGVAMVVASQLDGLQGIFTRSSEPLGLALGAFVIFGVGLVDDVRNISAPAKVAGQVLAAMVLVFLGVTMYWFKIPFDSHIINLAPSVLPLVTAVWVVGMANAVNLIDGLDGLAAGIVAIAAGALCVYGLQLMHLGELPSGDNGLGPLVAAIACGVCVGFLPHNFHPARIFMGDSGALFLGLLMAAATMIIGGRTSSDVGGIGTDVSGETFFRFAPLFIPFFILGVPILDTVFALIRRTIRRTSFAERDLGHLHHRLMQMGHGHRRAVLILWAWTAVLSAFALVPIFDSRANFIVPFAVAFLGAGLYTLFRPGARTRSQRHEGVSATSDVVPPHEASPSPLTPGPLPPSPLTPGQLTPGPALVPPISVMVSGAAGVAVAGEPGLASPRRRRRQHRRSRWSRPSTDERGRGPDRQLLGSSGGTDGSLGGSAGAHARAESTHGFADEDDQVER